MTKFSALLAGALLLGPTSALAATTTATTTTATATHAVRTQGRADHLPDGFSYLHDFATARAIVQIQDTGSALVVQGRGDGFDVGQQFVSLIYDTGSVRTGALACIPTSPNPFTPAQMFVGYWYPATSRARVLSASNTSFVPIVKSGAAYVPRTQIATISVRYDSTPTLSPLVNQNPGRFWLQACGDVP